MRMRSKHMESERRIETKGKDLSLGPHAPWPKVTIVILTWNNYEDTKECLESLGKITYPNYEIIVVDNGSTDGSIDKLEKEFSWVKFVKNESNKGYTGGNNIGIKYALKKGSDYILILNNDTVVGKDFLEPLLETAQSDPDIGIVGGKITCYDDPSRIESVWNDHGWGVGAIKIGEGEIDLGQYNKERQVQGINGAMMLIKASVFLTVGFFDESYFLYVDETEFCYRVKNKFKIVYEPRSVVLHKGSKSSGRESPVSLYYSRRNILRFMTTYSSSKFELWFALGRYLFTTLHKFFIYSFKGETQKAQAVVKAYLDYIRGKSGRQRVTFKSGGREMG